MSTHALLERNEHWLRASRIFTYAWPLLEDFHDEERHDMEESLRQSAFDLTEDTAMAAGSFDPRDRMHYLGAARRDLFRLKNCLIMAKRAGYLKPDPQIMLLCDELANGLAEDMEVTERSIQEYLKQFERADGAEHISV